MLFAKQMKLIEFWFPNDKFNKFWFDKSKDLYIKNNFIDNLIYIEKSNENFKELNDLEILEKIIYLDQISRNIYRNNKIKIKNNDVKALEMAMYYLNERDWSNIKLTYLIFYLMPLRHTFKKEYYDKIFEILNYYKKRDDDKHLFDKFFNVTQKIYQNIIQM